MGGTKDTMLEGTWRSIRSSRRGGYNHEASTSPGYRKPRLTTKDIGEKEGSRQTL